MYESKAHGDSIGAYEAKTHLSDLLDRVHKGEEITITKHGTPIARLVPVTSNATSEERRATIERLLAMREEQSLDGVKIADLIAEGRR